MPKPTTKQALIEAAQTERTALQDLISTLTAEQLTSPNRVGEWSAKDVFAHLMEWEQMVIRWYQAGVKGKMPAVPSEKYNWAQLPQLNHDIYLKYRDVRLEDIQKEFRSSSRKIMKLIESIPESEFFTRGQYPWTRNNTLAAYFVSATSSHYLWARTTIRKTIKK